MTQKQTQQSNTAEEIKLTVLKYCTDILSGVIPSGLPLRNAVSRFKRDILETGENTWVMNWELVVNVVKFIAKLKHFTGIHAKKPFVLMPWQLFIVANLYGFIMPDGTRRFQTAYLEMARKQGKTALVAALSL